MVENIKPNSYLADSKISAKDNKNKKGEFTGQSQSTGIPKPIVNKLGLQKGQVLYWDINEDSNIIITPEVNKVTTPEEASIEAGTEILNNMLIQGNTASYLNSFSKIKTNLEAKAKDDTDKITSIVTIYNNFRNDTEKEAFKNVVIYLLDYPLNIPNQFEIMREVYNQITENE